MPVIVALGTGGYASDYLWSAALRYTIEKKRAENSYCHLATLSSDGSPSNRTVVFRGMVAGTDALKVITDTRGEKVRSCDVIVCEILGICSHEEGQFESRRVREICTQSTSLERSDSWNKLGGKPKHNFLAHARAGCDPRQNPHSL